MEYKYAIISRYYRVGRGWDEWPTSIYDSVYGTLEDARRALKKDRRHASDDVDYKIVEIPETVGGYAVEKSIIPYQIIKNNLKQIKTTNK